MNNNVSLTIASDDADALVAGATMLLTLAGKIPAMALDDLGENIDADRSHIEAKIPASQGGTGPETAALVIATPPADDVIIDPATVFEQPATTVPPVELDAEGLPWDARIHSGAKSKIKNDTLWRKKPGVDKSIIPAVEAELRALMSASVTTAVVAPPDDGAVVAPPDDGAVVAPPADVNTGVTNSMTFPQFLKACSDKMSTKDVTMAQILEVLNKHGIASLQLVKSREDMIPQLWADISNGIYRE